MPNFATWPTCANINTSVRHPRPCCQRPPKTRNSATAPPDMCTHGEPTRVASHSSHLAKTQTGSASRSKLAHMRQHQHQRPPPSSMLPTTAKNKKLRHRTTRHVHSRGTNPRGLPFVPSRENSRAPCQTSQLGPHAPTSTPASATLVHAANDRQKQETPPPHHQTCALTGNQPAWPPIRPISRKLARTMPIFSTWPTCANINTLSLHAALPI